MSKRVIFIIAFQALWFSGLSGFSETEGERLFKSNRFREAITALEKEILAGNITRDTYNFLGLSYYQNGDYEKAFDAFERGMQDSSSNKKIICFNEGNVAYAKGDYSKAESCFSLALAVSPDFYPALLNRANTYLSEREYNKALSDYKDYLRSVPGDSQSGKIRKLISYLEDQLVFMAQEEKRQAEENARLMEENARIQAELAKKRAAEEEARKAEMAREAERRRKLLEDVANSLQQTDSMNMTAGAEDVIEYDYESELD